MQLYFSGIANNEITIKLALSAVDISRLSSIMLYSISAMLIPAGLLLDRICPKKLLFISSILCLVGIALIYIHFSITNFVPRALFGVQISRRLSGSR
jgi:hypothetical protein